MMVVDLELIHELEAAAAPAPDELLLDLVGLRTATRLKRLTYKCNGGKVVVSEFIALKTQRDTAADVCRICLGPGTVRPDADDEGGERLLRDSCLCRGSVGCIHEHCLVRWYETAGLPADPRCPTCLGKFRNEGGLVLSRRLVAHRRAQAAQRTKPETPTVTAQRHYAEITEATELWRRCDYKGAKTRFETALSEIRCAHDGDKDMLRGDIYYVTATLNLALVELNMGNLDAAERGARWAQAALSGSDQELRATHNLALILDERGLVAEAAALYEDVHSSRTDQLGAAHPDSLRTACNLGRCYTRLGSTDSAVQLLRETRAAALVALGGADELTLAAAHNLSEAHAARSEYSEARQLALASLDSRRQVLGESHVHTLRSTLDLARLLQADPAGAHDEAIQLCAAAAAGLERLLGRDHAQTCRARKLLEQWRGLPPPVVPTKHVADGRERVALLETMDVPDEKKRAVLDALVVELCARGVATLVALLLRDDPLRDRAWDAVVGVADLESGTLFAHRLNV